jgi:hypothetical protein
LRGDDGGNGGAGECHPDKAREKQVLAPVPGFNPL